jgi:hypothetical protein
MGLESSPLDGQRVRVFGYARTVDRRPTGLMDSTSKSERQLGLGKRDSLKHNVPKARALKRANGGISIITGIVTGIVWQYQDFKIEPQTVTKQPFAPIAQLDRAADF